MLEGQGAQALQRLNTTVQKEIATTINVLQERHISARDGGTVQTLANTGMPLGIDAEASWKRATVQFEPGDILLLYTDGVTDAQNAQGEFIDRGMLTNVIRDRLGAPAHELKEAILNEVHNFVGQAPQFDDITLVILKREP